jgi:class 3 adenylate cyclase
MHRTGDRVVSVHAGRWLARQISGARLAEFPGADHILFVGEVAPVLGEIEEFVTGQRGAPESPDRVLATVLFADIVDSTAQAAALGDSAWARRRDSFLDAIRRELARHRGTEIKTTGDGLLATFDGPGRGLRCAAAIDAAAAEHAIQIRQGLHSGECDVRDGDVSGIAVHIAARVAALADAGEILASSTVRDLVVGSDLEFVERGSRELRGVPGEWRLYALAAG